MPEKQRNELVYKAYGRYSHCPRLVSPPHFGYWGALYRNLTGMAIQKREDSQNLYIGEKETRTERTAQCVFSVRVCGVYQRLVTFREL